MASNVSVARYCESWWPESMIFIKDRYCEITRAAQRGSLGGGRCGVKNHYRARRETSPTRIVQRGERTVSVVVRHEKEIHHILRSNRIDWTRSRLVSRAEPLAPAPRGSVIARVRLVRAAHETAVHETKPRADHGARLRRTRHRSALSQRRGSTPQSGGRKWPSVVPTPRVQP